MIDIPKIRLGQSESIDRDLDDSGDDEVFIPKIGLEGNSNNEGKKLKNKKKKKKNSFFKRNRKAITILSVFLVIIVIFLSISGLLLFRTYKKGLQLQASAVGLVDSVNQQDLALIKKDIADTRQKLQSFKDSYGTISWMRFIPYFGSYVEDMNHATNAAKYGLEAADILVEVIEPYADIIGFAKDGGDGPQSGEDTAQDRLDFVVKTIPDIIPKAGELAEKMKLVQDEIDKIESDKYPERLGDYEVRGKVEKGKNMVDLATSLVIEGKPLLEAAPYILGTNQERKYMVIFQNDKELRPTGGFITAYSIAIINQGKFEPVISDDIYNLDNNYNPTETAPKPIRTYLKGPYLISNKLRLRDMNWSPDFEETMKLFVEEIESVGIDDIDGVIAVDTQLLVNILDALGPIGVPGYGNYSTEIVPECDCPQVIYELESFADIEGPIVWSENEPGKIVFAPPNYDNRKKIIGPLMNSILSNALGQSKEKIPALFEAVFKSLLEKHVLFYMLDDKAQEGVESFGVAGKVEDYPGDYLYVNDANLGGRKSNLYVTQEVVQEVEVSRDGSVVKTLTITYKNPAAHDGWLNSVLPNYVRIYVPKGSELVDFSGVEEKEEPYEEFGKTVFAGFFELRPQGVAKVNLQYKLPIKFDDEYNLLIQKQPGKDAPLYTINVGKKRQDLFLRRDEEFEFSI